jgi:hypothetical protein
MALNVDDESLFDDIVVFLANKNWDTLTEGRRKTFLKENPTVKTTEDELKCYWDVVKSRRKQRCYDYRNPKPKRKSSTQGGVAKKARVNDRVFIILYFVTG